MAIQGKPGTWFKWEMGSYWWAGEQIGIGEWKEKVLHKAENKEQNEKTHGSRILRASISCSWVTAVWAHSLSKGRTYVAGLCNTSGSQVVVVICSSCHGCEQLLYCWRWRTEGSLPSKSWIFLCCADTPPALLVLWNKWIMPIIPIAAFTLLLSHRVTCWGWLSKHKIAFSSSKHVFENLFGRFCRSLVIFLENYFWSVSCSSLLVSRWKWGSLI